MKSNYKQLGRHIRPVDVRNRDLAVSRLLGVSIAKEFMPSIANTVGTDMSSYKIVRKGQFAYGPVTSRNGDKISVALLREEECIISQAYTAFEIIDTNELDPEYLMLWFSRPEFDRYARYHSHGSVREIFGWDEMCRVELPVPDIEEQKALASSVTRIRRRIDANKKLIDKLQKATFAYYSSVIGEVEVSPDTNICQYGRIGGGGTPDTGVSNFWDGEISFYTPSDSSDCPFTNSYTEKTLTAAGVSACSTKIYPKGTVFITARGTVGKIQIASQEMAMNQSCYAFIPNPEIPSFIAYLILKGIVEALKKAAHGAVFGAIVTKDILAVPVPELSNSEIQTLSTALSKPFELMRLLQFETERLKEAETLLIQSLSLAQN